jgi:hypothetical protein
MSCTVDCSVFRPWEQRRHPLAGSNVEEAGRTNKDRIDGGGGIAWLKHTHKKELIIHKSIQVNHTEPTYFFS